MRLTDKDLDDMIDSLQEYVDRGVYDPWLLSDGRVIQPLDVLKELREARRAIAGKSLREDHDPMDCPDGLPEDCHNRFKV